MYKTLCFLAAAAAVAAIQTPAQALQLPGTGTVRAALADTNLVEQTAYVFGRKRYCFYRNGWHGPGWYRCGFSYRHGLGWGGVYGWNSWTYPGYALGVRTGRGHRGHAGQHQWNRSGQASAPTTSRGSRWSNRGNMGPGAVNRGAMSGPRGPGMHAAPGNSARGSFRSGAAGPAVNGPNMRGPSVSGPAMRGPSMSAPSGGARGAAAPAAPAASSGASAAPAGGPAVGATGGGAPSGRGG